MRVLSAIKSDVEPGGLEEIVSSLMDEKRYLLKFI